MAAVTFKAINRKTGKVDYQRTSETSKDVHGSHKAALQVLQWEADVYILPHRPQQPFDGVLIDDQGRELVRWNYGGGFPKMFHGQRS